MPKDLAEKKRMLARLRYYKNREKNLKAVKDYRDRNKEKVALAKKLDAERNKDRVKNTRMRYYLKNKESIDKRVKNWKKNNRARLNERNRQRYKTDIAYRITVNYRNRFYDVVKNKRTSKSIKFLGCSIDHFKEYLESLFTKKMTWENYGTYWHIDHIMPCASFDLTDEAHQKRCFHYTNMQPLEAKKNLTKNKTQPQSHQFLLL